MSSSVPQSMGSQGDGSQVQQQGMQREGPDVSGSGMSGLGSSGMENGGQYWQHMQQQEQQQALLHNQGFPQGLMSQPGAMTGYPYFGQVGQQTFMRAQPHAGFFDQRGYPAGYQAPQLRPGMALPNGALPHMAGGGGDMGVIGGPLDGSQLQQMQVGRGRPFPPGTLHRGHPDFGGMVGGDAGVDGFVSGGEIKGRKAPKRSLAATIERMEKHKILERKRREKTKELMAELQKLIPTEQEMGDSPTMNTVLEEAIEHLKNMAAEAQQRAKHACTCGAPGVGSNPYALRSRSEERDDDDEGEGARSWQQGSEQFAAAAEAGIAGEELIEMARKAEKPATKVSPTKTES